MSFHHSFSDVLTPSFSFTLKRKKKKRSIYLQISSLEERPQDCDLPQPHQNKQNNNIPAIVVVPSSS